MIVAADFVCSGSAVCSGQHLVRVFVHFVDGRLEVFLHFVALRFHCRREKTVLNAEQIMVQVNVLGLLREEKGEFFGTEVSLRCGELNTYQLEALQAAVLADLGDVLEDNLLEFLALAKLLHVQLQVVLTSPLEDDCLLGNDDGNERALVAVAVDEHLSHVFGADVEILDLLGSNVLALLELENVLDAVDDLERTVLEKWKHVKLPSRSFSPR